VRAAECCRAPFTRLRTHGSNPRGSSFGACADLWCGMCGPIVTFRTVARKGHEAHTHGIAVLRLFDRRHAIVANLIAAIFKAHGAAGVWNALKTGPDGFDRCVGAVALPLRQVASTLEMQAAKDKTAGESCMQ